MEEFANRFIMPTDIASTLRSRAVEAGNLFVGQIDRPSVAIATTFYWLVTANTKDVLVLDIDPRFNIGAVTTGALIYRTDVFLQNSIKNDYVYVPGTANASFGSPTNGYFINRQSDAKLSSGGSVPTLTGSPDFILTDANYFLATQGNSNSSSGTKNTFFEQDNYIIIPAGTTALFRSVSSGTAGGTYGVNTSISFAERLP
jgi:hypothetical protein